MVDQSKLRVLFICTHNSARSQMAEGWLRHLGGDRFDAHSAGTEATAVRPLAIRAMDDVGIDISGQESKTLDRYLQQSWDCVITVCDRANDHCPAFPDDPVRIHWSCPDPALVDDDAARRRAFDTVWLELNTRIGHLLNLPHPATGRRLQLSRPTGQGHAADR